ncbi:IS481 family transposase domain protein [Rickettsiales endosymbiont of Paramecium tredecaurelia]|nr:IS481 family transposase domain protein [Candidatus Sarmatiella mevalonica]
MGQILHANARTTEAIRREIRDSKESIEKAAKRLDLLRKYIELEITYREGLIFFIKRV